MSDDKGTIGRTYSIKQGVRDRQMTLTGGTSSISKLHSFSSHNLLTLARKKYQALLPVEEGTYMKNLRIMARLDLLLTPGGIKGRTYTNL